MAEADVATVEAWRKIVSAARRLGFELDVLSPRVLEKLSDQNLLTRMYKAAGVPPRLAEELINAYRLEIVYTFTSMALDLLEDSIASALAGKRWEPRLVRLALRVGGRPIMVEVRAPPPRELLSVEMGERGFVVKDWRGRVVLRDPTLVFRAARNLDRRAALAMLERAFEGLVGCEGCKAEADEDGGLLAVTGPGLEARFSLTQDKYEVRAQNEYFEKVLKARLPFTVRYEAEGIIPPFVDPTELLANTLYTSPRRFAWYVTSLARQYGERVESVEGGPHQVLLRLADGSTILHLTP